MDNTNMLISDKTRKLTRAQRRRQAQKFSYLQRAVERFLEGTPCRAPEEVVARGLRSLEDWTLILADELEQKALRDARGKSAYVRVAY
jgi:hypothetical protein